MVVFDQPGIQGEPAAVRGLDPVRDHHMRMHLRVQGAARVLTEHRRRDPGRVQHRDLTTDPVAGVRMTLDPLHDGCHGGIVRSEHVLTHARGAEGEQGRHRLRSRARHIEPAHRPHPGGAPEVPVRPGRVHPGHHRQERLIGHLARQAQHPGRPTQPHATRFVGVEVVRRQRLHVVRPSGRAPQRRHAHRHHTPPRARVTVHSSVIPAVSVTVAVRESMTAYTENRRGV